jgi:hypothetical protein
MFGERSLTLPLCGSRQVGQIPHLHIAELLAFSGSAFFANAPEQNAYCDFLGLCPRPRSRIEDDAFQRGDIQPDGFFPPSKRGEAHVCAFQKSPVQFISELLADRGWKGHAADSHVSQILRIGRRAHNLKDED